MRLLSRHLPAIVAGCVGATISFGGFYHVGIWEQSRLRDVVTREAERESALIQREIELTMEAVASFAGLHAALQGVEEDEFRAFTRPLLRRHDGISAISWMPQVSASQRSDFEAEVRGRGLTAFQISDRSPEGGLRPAFHRPFHFPVLFSESQTPDARDRNIGFDAWSDPNCRAAMTEARDVGHGVLTQPLGGTATGSRPAAVMAFHPVYRSGAAIDTVDRRRSALVGYLSAAIDLEQLLSEALRGTPTARGMVIDIFDVGSSAGQSMLYRHVPADMRIPAGGEIGSSDAPVLVRLLETGGRTWSVEFHRAGGEPPIFGGAAAAVLCGGLLLTALLVIYLCSVGGRNARIARLVTQRTADLETANDSLRQEIAERQLANAELEQSEKRYRMLVEALPEAIFIVRDSMIIFTNPAMVRLVGAKSSDEVVGRDVFDFVNPDDHAFIRNRRRELLRTTEPLGLAELRYRLIDGQEVVVETTSSIVAWEGKPANLVFVRDISERKRAEAALRASEERFRDFADAGSDWMWETDRNLRFIWISDSVAERTGRPVADIIGKAHWEIDGVDGATDEVREHMEQRLPFRGIRFARADPDGQTRHRSINGRPFYDRAGNFRGYRGTTSDITSEVEARRAANRIEQRFVSALDAISESLALYDADDRLVLCNNEFRRVSGVPPECHKPGSTFESMIRARVEGGLIDGVDDFNREEWVAARMARHRNPSGPYTFCSGGRWRQVREERLADGSTVLMSTEVTDQVLAEQALRESEAQLRRVTDAVPAQIAYIDRHLHLGFANRSFLDWHGISAEDAIGKHLSDVLSEETFRRNVVYSARVLAGETVTTEGPTRRHEGQEAYVRITRVPHFSEENETLGYFVVALDLTERHRQEERLLQSRKMEMVDQLIGGVAHEFNNLITLVLGSLELLEEEPIADRPARQLIEYAKKGALRGGELTRRLLAIAGRQNLRADRVELEALIEETVLSQSPGDGITLEVSADSDLWPVVADRVQLATTLTNFITNARDAMPDGGTIKLKAANAKLKTADLPSGIRSAGREFVLLEVSDDGIGMSPEVAKRVPEPFFTTKGETGGSGLGLSMAYSFAERSGGFLKIESTEGAGTNVCLYLPRAEQISASDDPAATSVETANRRVGTLLVVEDDEDVRKLVVRQLRQLGYTVLEAGDGETALEIIDDRDDVDLLFCDVVLPRGVRGPDVAAKARARHPGLRIVFTTGYAESATGGLAIEGAAADVLFKPYRQPELAAAIAAALGERDQV